ncbi:hypothetical protein [Roseivirga sp.]|uniref:hypothetical protein n=1 Tax=Roseivirga sp. TaxID=1964215 RepID=UPI003B8B37AD
MKKSLLIALTLFISFSAFSQKDYFVQEDSTTDQGPALALKLIPSQLLWRFQAYAIGLEHRLTESLALDYSLGIVANKNSFDDDALYFANKSGFKSSVMLKSYQLNAGALGSLFNILSGDDQPGSSVRPYVGFEAFFNNINFDRTRTFRFDCGNDCDYFQRVTYGINQRDIGARLNVGFEVDIVNPVGFEVNWAIGFMSRSLRPDDRKPIGYEQSFGVFYSEDIDEILLSTNLNIKLVINLK